MEKSTRYFQLAPDILVEYIYNELGNANDQTGDATGHILDLEMNGHVIYDDYNFTRTFMWTPLEDGFVLPVNKSESKFKLCKHPTNPENKLWTSDRSHFIDFPIRENSNIGNADPDDILIDNFRLHFTSRNYLGGSYDGFIITISIYDTRKNKVNLMSQYVRKTDDPTINETPVLINQKLYTTYMDFRIPNVTALVEAHSEYVKNRIAGEGPLKDKLSPTYDVMENTPIMMSIYGVKSTYIDRDDYECYNVEKLNTIYIPIIDKTNSLYFVIKEATRDSDTDFENARRYEYGDYFVIYPEIDNGEISFSDYLYNISDGRPELYIVFHELSVIEYVNTGSAGVNTHEGILTHREQFVINGGLRDGEGYKTNEDGLDTIMYYRPVIRNANNSAGFTIDVKTYIINTLDNTTIVKHVSADFDADTAKKYGIHMNKIYLGEIPSQVRVYNKKPDIDVDLVKITNASSKVKIENHQHSIIGFIECANVGVSIEQIPTELLQQQ